MLQRNFLLAACVNRRQSGLGRAFLALNRRSRAVVLESNFLYPCNFRRPCAFGSHVGNDCRAKSGGPMARVQCFPII